MDLLICSKALSVRASILRVKSRRRTRASSSSSMSVEERETIDMDDEIVGGLGKTSWLSRGDVGMVIGGKSKESGWRSTGVAFCKSSMRLAWSSCARRF